MEISTKCLSTGPSSDHNESSTFETYQSHKRPSNSQVRESIQRFAKVLGSKIPRNISSPSISLLLAIFLFFLVCIPSSHASREGNCTNMPTKVMERPGVRYEISGYSILMYPIDGAGNRIQNISCEWTFEMLVERAKSLDENGTGHLVPLPVSPAPGFDLLFLIEGSEESDEMHVDGVKRAVKTEEEKKNFIQSLRASEASKGHSARGKNEADDAEMQWRARESYVDEIVDPLEERDETKACSTYGTPRCGELLNFIRVSEMDCYGIHETKPFMGYDRESYWLHLSHPSYPSFQLVIEHHLMDTFLDYWGNTSGVQEHYQYRPNHLKVGYQMIDFPWAGPSDNIVFGPDWNNGSSIDFWSNLTVRIDLGEEVIATYEVNAREKMFSTKTVDGLIEVAARVSSIVELDGVGFANLDDRNRSISVPVPRVVSKSQIKETIGAASVGHWRHLRYDPSFVALFSELASQMPSPGKSNGSQKGMIIGMSVSFSIIAIGILTVVLLFTFIPSLRQWIRPHASRVETSSSEAASPSPRSPPSSWTSASPSSPPSH